MAAPALNEAREKVIRFYRDPVDYIEKLLVIRNKRGKVIPFILNDVQRRVQEKKREAIAKGRPARFLVLKSRRMGITTLEQALNFWTVAMHPNRQVLTLAHRSESTEKIFRISNFFYEKITPQWRPQRLTKQNKRDINLPLMNSLFYIDTAGSRGIARGDTLQRVHWSEVAWTKGGVQDQANILDGLTEACSEGEIVLETTANGVGDLFHSLWLEATMGESEWTPIFVPWWEDRSYRVPLSDEERREIAASYTDEEKALVKVHNLIPEQIAWRRKKKKGVRLFAQEYPEDATTCFLVSGTRFFDALIIEAIIKRTPGPTEGKDSEIRVWKKPVPGRKYVIGADCSEGVAGGDYSFAGVVDAETMEQVAAIRGLWKPADFAARIDRLARQYNMARVVVERNNHGHSVINTLSNVLHYPNMYKHREYDQKAGTYNFKLGFPTDAKTRPILLDDLRDAVEAGHMLVHDLIFCAECTTFHANENGKYEARKGCHDDTIFGWGMALQGRKRLGESAEISSRAAPTVPASNVFPRKSRRFF